ncbi:MAG: MmgE/PrpD family protein, partial [Chloroflexota bacterium]
AKAAANGYQSAAFAAAGLNSATDIIGGRRGFWAVLSPNGHNEEALTGALGEHWELQRNGLKPYANGVVSHPIQDAVIRLRNEHALTPDQVVKIQARVCPLVLELMNRPNPTTGLDAKFSFQHCAAAALVDGAGHDAQFSDARVLDPVIASVRSRVSATVDQAIPEHEVFVTITLTDGREVSTHVEHASGSPENPLSDATLDTKFRALVEPVIGASRAATLLDAARNLDGAPNVAELLRLAAR